MRLELGRGHNVQVLQATLKVVYSLSIIGSHWRVLMRGVTGPKEHLKHLSYQESKKRDKRRVKTC